MREIHSSDEVVFRGGRKPWEDDQTLLTRLSSSAVHQTSGVRVRTWLLGILGFLLASLIVINSFVTGQFRITHFVNATAIRNNYVEAGHAPLMSPKITGYLVSNKGCRIAALDPHDSISRRYVKIEKPIECEFGNQLPLIDSNDTAIFINPEAINQYYNESETIDCCWRSVNRKPDQDNAVSYGDECNQFINSATISTEFVKVECYQDGKQIYRDYHAFVPRKEETEKRCREANNGSIDRDRLSLLIVGLDSISRLNLHRMMPKTVKALMDLEAFEMMGYNKVGDNTYPNVVPVLSGMSSDELQKACWNDSKKPFDNCPFIWKNFSASGYRTIFAEDACSMTTFNYLKPGFRNPPTDYYLRPFCIAAESDIGNTHKLNSNLCLGTRKNFDNLLNYTLKVATRFVNDRYFGFFWQASLTHDFFNYPQLGDDSYSRLLNYLKDKKMLNNTALIVMSDHGMRWGDFRQTYQGRMEGSLPFVFVVLPEWWKNKYSMAVANMRRNTASLTTPYDLHETLLDIMNPQNINDETLRMRNKILNEGNITRGISWFLSIPNNRTCSMAGIPEHWCMCHTSNNVTIDDPAVKNSTKFLVDELNRLLKNYPQCSKLKLFNIMDAKMWSGNDEDQKEKSAPWTDYTITLQTEPGGAIFEGSIRHRHNDTSNKLVGTVSRLNAYGTQSACVDDFNMRLYCYCH